MGLINYGWYSLSNNTFIFHCFRSFLNHIWMVCYSKRYLLVNKTAKLKFPLRILQLTMKNLVNTLIIWQYKHDSYAGLWCTMQLNTQENYREPECRVKKCPNNIGWWFIVLITLDDLSNYFKGYFSSFIECGIL